MYNKNYISVGIDVGSAFSFMTIVAPDGSVIQKPFKITHNKPDSLEKAVSAIKKAEELHSLESRTFLESTGIYHFPLFCYLVDCGFHVSIINPIITHSANNTSIRKVKNDKVDSIGIAKLGLSGDVTGKTSTMILRQYGTPDKILRGHKKTMIEKISKASRKGLSKAADRYEKLCAAATAAKTFGCQIDSIYFNISLTLDLIEKLDSALDSILQRIHQLVTFNKSEKFIQQIKWLNTIKGVGFLTAVTIMCEIGDFSAFRNPKQLFAYFGLDPEVNQSGKFVGTEMHMTKRGSRIARRAIFAVALASIRTKRNGEGINPYLREYYEKKSGQKPKMVALGAVMHKVCNIIFAVLRDEKEFELRSPEEHCRQYQHPALQAA